MSSGNLGRARAFILSLFHPHIIIAMVQTRSSSSSEGATPSLAKGISSRPHADWKPDEVTELIKYLVDNMHERTSDSSTTFKDVVYRQAAEKITPYLQGGPRKTGAMCKTKWTSVCILFVHSTYPDLCG
jgi:hypothetical protein